MDREVDPDTREHAGEDRREQVQMSHCQCGKAERPGHTRQQRDNREGRFDYPAKRNYQ